MYTESEVLDYVEQEDVKFIRLAYFDTTGKQKNISIMAGELQKAFNEGIPFDASSVEGFEQPNQANLFLHPDPSTLSVLPWRPASGKVVRMFCDITYPNGKPYIKDSRYILKTAIEKAKNDYDLEFKFGTEFEFYLFKLDENGVPTTIPFDNAGYMDIAPEDKGENIRREIDFTLEKMGITPQSSYHEEGPGQNEIDFIGAEPLTAADNASTFKWVVRTKAAENGLYADFNPKPRPDFPGNGLHINLTCNDKEKLPKVLAGILNRMEELTYYLNPSKNSYERLGEHKGPKHICWGTPNYSAIISANLEPSTGKVQIRSSDSNCNIYITFALLIYASLDGIDKNLTPPAPTSENLFDPVVAKNTKFNSIPDNLNSARKIAESSEFIKKYIPF